MPNISDRTNLQGGLQRIWRGLQTRVLRAQEPVPIGDLQAIYWHGRHICRIDIERIGGTFAAGTGFLVGPNLVLTNYHVIEEKEEQPQHIVCRFDYLDVDPSNFTISDQIRVLEVLARKRYSESEQRGEYTSQSTIHPTDEQLDYALLKLSESTGKKAYKTRDGVVRRSWIKLSSIKPSIRSQSKVYILQHPKGRPLRHADGPLTNEQPAPTRIRYKTTTDYGSSGSPCFQFSAAKCEPVVVALHNYGDPGWGKGASPEFNHGIPIELIVQDIERLSIKLPPPPPPPPPPPRRPILWLLVAATIGVFPFVIFELPNSQGVSLAAPTYAWMLPIKTSDPESQPALVLNTSIIPYSKQTAHYAAAEAELLIEGKRYAMRARKFVDMREECIYSRIADCILGGSRLTRISEPAELELMLTPHSATDFPGWRTILQQIDNGSFEGFLYRIFYRLDDGPSLYSQTYQCNFSVADIYKIRNDKRFNFYTKLRPAISPGVNCKMENVDA